MSHTTAFVLALLILGIFALDAWVLDWDLPVLIGRQGLRLLEYLAFWR